MNEEKEHLLKLIDEELGDLEEMFCLTIQDAIEKRNAIHLLKNARFEIKAERNENEGGKELLHKLLKGISQ